MFVSWPADQQIPSGAMEVKEIKKMKYPDYEKYEGDSVVPEDSAFTEIIEQEFKYKRELWRLMKVLRRGMSSEDPLPMFNRRHLLLLVKRLCKDIDKSTDNISKTKDIDKLSKALEKSMPLSHCLLCIGYADTLDEMREFLRREESRRNDSSIRFCTELHAERSLLPLHRLKYISALSCISASQKNLLSSALDGCYTAISALHDHIYVEEIDSLLSFALNMDPPPKQYYSSPSFEPLYQELSPQIAKFDSKDDHMYEEIAPVLPKRKKKSFFSGSCIKQNGDVSAKEEFIPLSRLEHKVREMYA